jgi:hypothetical protein
MKIQSILPKMPRRVSLEIPHGEVWLTVQFNDHMSVIRTDMNGDQVPTPVPAHFCNCVADYASLTAFEAIGSLAKKFTLKILQPWLRKQVARGSTHAAPDIAVQVRTIATKCDQVCQ